ncbi:hypothetical protein Cgig2_018777 [Carnegiea gigantea]|uniref:TOG domain-containing protein n=1 Tax=Carnegiea gigantea TaxID=171969 RepID=A0A9Q1GTK3_9CARY|nr:hypothetical protein Cgig2_018777 [Carnegiea gigantea]
MKEHKNPKVLSEGILWMVSAVEDFGVSHLKLKDLIDFCKETGFQSSAAATRNATIKMIGVLHKFVGPDIGGFLSDVKPALLCALDAEYEKNPYEGPSVAPKRTVKASDALSTPAVGSDGLPREDISGKITPTLLKGFESPDWKTRLDSIEAVNNILEEANKRIQPTGTGELFGALRGRLYDSNKKLVMEALSTIGSVASAMGPPVEKASKGILSDVLKCLGDNKKHMRECTLRTVDAWLVAVHLDKMIPYFITALSEPKLGAEGRKDLLEWLSKQLLSLSDFPDAVHLLKPTSVAMADKSADVRKAAEVCINGILRACSPEMMTKNLKDLQGPAFAIVAEKLKSYAALPELHGSSHAVADAKLSKATARVRKVGTNPPVVVRHRTRSISSDLMVQQRPGPTKGARADSIVSVHDISIQSQPLLNIKDSNKEAREKMVVCRFKFEEPHSEQIQDLETGLAKYFREDLSRRLMSTDFKEHVNGIEIIHRALPSIGKDIIEVIDILLRCVVLRFCESNAKCVMKVLEFLPQLVEALTNEGYVLTDAEAAIFLPCLVEKSGYDMEKLREKIRVLTRQIVSIYPAAKVFPYVVEGLRSKNNRTRIECADLVGHFLENHLSKATSQKFSLLWSHCAGCTHSLISGQLKILQIVASLTAERNGEIRKAAVNTLATGYKTLASLSDGTGFENRDGKGVTRFLVLVGEDIWRYLGKLTDAQRSMIDEKFKMKARDMEKRRGGRPGDSRAALRRSARDNRSKVAEQSGEALQSTAGQVFARENYARRDAHVERNVFATTQAGVSGPTDWNNALDVLAYGSPEQSVEGMKVVLHELAQVTNYSEGSTMADIVKDVDRLVSILAKKVAKSFDFNLAGISSRFCKYVFQTLMQYLVTSINYIPVCVFIAFLMLFDMQQAFQNKTLAHAVKECTLNNLITELLLWLLDERVRYIDDGDQVRKAWNFLMLKILDNADRTSSFVVLVNLLRPLDPSKWPFPISIDAVAVKSQTFSELVVKFLIKLTKDLESTIYDIDVDCILQSIHVYLQELGMEEVRRRAGADDKPLRMVKTVLHEVVKLHGAAIKAHLSMIPENTEPRPIILALIDLYLQVCYLFLFFRLKVCYLFLFFRLKRNKASAALLRFFSIFFTIVNYFFSCFSQQYNQWAYRKLKVCCDAMA